MHPPIARLLSAAAQLAITELNERLAARGHPDMRPAFGYALLAIDGHGTTTSQLGARLAMTKQGAAKVADQLIGRGYVRRRAHPTDRRAQILVRTPKGDDVLRLAEDIQRDLEREWADRARARDLVAMRRALEQVLAVDAPATLRPLA
jgi:DNA-binding MarR family transcriptional regulator